LADAQWERMDVLVLPTAAVHPTLAEVAADPVPVNSKLGRFTNFANLLDTCALAIPCGMDGHLPAGLTLFAPAWHDALLARLGATFLGEAAPAGTEDDGITLAVFGAHLRGQPLNPYLVSLGGQFLSECSTAPVYRLHRVEGPLRPGLVRVAADGIAIPGELWRLSAAGFGRFTASINAPLAIGSVQLADGTVRKGFVCEAAGAGPDISAAGSWRAYLAGEAARAAGRG
jgi:allophanate hydrolase